MTASDVQKANCGGGGAASGAYYITGGGGGGGYASNGKPGRHFTHGYGGNTYGNSELFSIDGKNVHLGSGGGCGYDSLQYFNGGRGGGAIVINCSEMILISKDATITVEGERGSVSLLTIGGCGSGGSVYLRAPNIVNHGKICADGGTARDTGFFLGGNGGDGRIEYDIVQD